MATIARESDRLDVFAEPVSEVGQYSQGKLMRMRFARNKLAMIGFVGLCIMYVLVGLAPFLSPNDYMLQNDLYQHGPPTRVTFRGPDGRLGLTMYTHPVTTELNMETFLWVFAPDTSVFVPVRFFVRGDPYELFGLFPTDIRLFGTGRNDIRIYPLGTDLLGRDMLARTLHGGQISMTIGLLGVALSILFGSVMGTASGYYGGLIDDVMQRIIEVIMAFPTVPLWAALAAALPRVGGGFTMLHRYFFITVILSLVTWTGLARQLRAKVMAYSRSDFTMAALAAGASDTRVIFVHMLPNAASHIIVVAALAIPGMILGETALSFLGLGILPPLVSWGALLRAAQQLPVILHAPWLLLPGLAVIVTVLLFSFLGDGLRDAVDPYSI